MKGARLSTEGDRARLTGTRVFVLEDESLVLFNIEDILTDLGCAIVGPAMRLEQADELFEQAAAADLAILDVNIAGRPVFPLAERLRERGTPLIFATGYGRAGLPEEWQNAPVLQKPYTMDDVVAAMHALTATIAR